MRINPVMTLPKNCQMGKANATSNAVSYNTVQPKLNNAQKVNFGISVSSVLLFVSGLIVTAIEGFAYCVCAISLIASVCDAYNSLVGSKNREKSYKETQDAKEEQIQLLMKKLNISRNEAEKYHDKFLGIAMIKPTEDGHEKGINAIMGYGKEKYRLAMEVLSPIISAQNNSNEELRKTIPNGILLYGPGGSGKTYMAEHLCEHLKEFGVNIKEFKFDINNHEQNCNNLRKVFIDAEENFKRTGKYTVIRFPQDIDGKFDNGTRYRDERYTFMEYAENSASKGAIWITTANNPKEIYQPVLRRTTMKMPIGNMQDFQIADMLYYEIIGMEGKDKAKKVDYQKIVDYIKENNLEYTPDEYKIFVQNTEACDDISAESIIQTIESYNDEGYKTLDDDMKAKFKSDQDYVDSLDDIKEE